MVVVKRGYRQENRHTEDEKNAGVVVTNGYIFSRASKMMDMAVSAEIEATRYINSVC